MINFLKRRWFIILLLVLAVGLGVLWFSARSKPAPPALAPQEPIKPPSSKYAEEATGVFNIPISPPSLPNSLPVYSVAEFSQDNPPQSAVSLAAEFGISLDAPKRLPSGSFFWGDEEKSLVLEVPSGRFTVSGSVRVAESLSGLEAQDFALKKAVETGLVQQVHGVNTRLFVSEDLELRPAAPGEDADVFVVTVVPRLENLSVIGAGKAQTYIEFRLTKAGILTRVRANLHHPSQALGDYPLRSFQEAVNELQQGKGQAISLTTPAGEAATPLSYEPLETASVSSVALAYFDTGEEQTIFQPVFVFSGEGVTQAKSSVSFQVMVPAISSALFIP